MRLSASNIAWTKEEDPALYVWLAEQGFKGLEIAPTRIFPEDPYGRIPEAKVWSAHIKEEYGLSVSSMQSIWYGRTERLFFDKEERTSLLEYTKKAIDFAAACRCENLVFGCPKNRALPEGSDAEIAISFFKELGDYAKQQGTAIGFEANPVIYGTNYINDTGSALALIRKVSSEGFCLNLDTGTVIENGEDCKELQGHVSEISHVHISEPGLTPIKPRELHTQLRELLKAEGYQGYISVEMGRTDRADVLFQSLEYVKSVFGEDG